MKTLHITTLPTSFNKCDITYSRLYLKLILLINDFTYSSKLKTTCKLNSWRGSRALFAYKQSRKKYCFSATTQSTKLSCFSVFYFKLTMDEAAKLAASIVNLRPKYLKRLNLLLKNVKMKSVNFRKKTLTKLSTLFAYERPQKVVKKPFQRNFVGTML